MTTELWGGIGITLLWLAKNTYSQWRFRTNHFKALERRLDKIERKIDDHIDAHAKGELK